MSTLPIRQRLVDIARSNVGKTEVTRNRAPWIAPLWKATTYPKGMENREPYCAAGTCWALSEWGKLPGALDALRMTPAQFEKWRCKSPAAFAWGHWAREKGLRILDKNAEFHTADIVIYSFSHIEIYTGDLPDRRFTAVGYNTNSAGSRDGDGCFEKPRTRAKIKEVIRILP